MIKFTPTDKPATPQTCEKQMCLFKHLFFFLNLHVGVYPHVLSSFPLKIKGETFKMASSWCKDDFVSFGRNGAHLGRRRVRLQPTTVSLPASPPYVRISPLEVFDPCPWTDWGEIYTRVETSGRQDAKQVHSVFICSCVNREKQRTETPRLAIGHLELFFSKGV